MASKKPKAEKMKLVGVRMTENQIKAVKRAARLGRESFSAYVRRQCGVKP